MYTKFRHPDSTSECENFPEIAEKETELRKYIDNFLNSELGQTVLSVSKTHTNQQIHADIEEPYYRW